MDNLPDFTKLSNRVVRILGLNPGKFTLKGTNTYLIGTGSQRILLDTGEGKPKYIPLLIESLKKSGEDVQISDILLSHYHLDHIGGVEGILQFARENSFPMPHIHKKPDPSHEVSFSESILPVVDKQIFKTDGATLHAISTPGHTKDHVAYYLEEENAIFSGDCVLGEGTTVFEDLKEYISSLEKMKLLNPGRIYPGHGPVVEDGAAKLDEYIQHRTERERQIMSVFKENKHNSNPLTPRQIVEIIYAAYPKSLWPAAEAGVILHLKKLESEEKVKRMTEEDIKGEWLYLDDDAKI